MDGGKSDSPESTPGAGSLLSTLRRWLSRAGILTFPLVAALVAVGLYRWYQPSPEPPSAEEIDAIVAEAMASATPGPAFSSQVYRTIRPSLVLVQTQRENADEGEDEGVGSGVIINGEGDILTALHVVEGVSQVNVVFADGTRASAETIASQPEIDIAVLHPSQPPEVIVPAVLASLGSVSVGDEAYAVGNPFGLPESMSAGVISGFNRSVSPDNSGQRIAGMIQFDAAVNPGNSGGPLLNRHGQVIGIVTGLANPSDESFFIGIGLAVPIAVAASAAGAPPY